MSTKAEKILALAVNFEKNATDSMVAEAKKKEQKKLDPKAKVRNRGTVCVPAESAKDKKDHFPINNEAQARNALARVNQFSSVPDWYSGSLQSLVSLVAKKVKAKYPSIEVSKDAKKPGKKAYLEQFESLISKFGQAPDYSAMKTNELARYPKATLDYLLQFNMISPEQYSATLSHKALVERAKIPSGAPGSPEYNPVDNSIDLDAVKPTPAAKGNYSKEVEIAQQQLANMGGYDLGNSGRYGNGVDGQLGPKTREALKKFNPYVSEQQAIKELVQRYNAGPDPVKPEPTQPENVAQKPEAVTKTWGA